MLIPTSPHSPQRSLRGRRRGNVLAMVMATIFVLVTCILVFHHQQSLARNSLLRSEAELRFREAKNFALREHEIGISAPWGLDMNVGLEDVTPESAHQIPANYGKDLFQKKDGQWSGLPDLMDRDFAPAHRLLRFTASGWGGLNAGVRKGSYDVVETEIPGYAAYAPNGNIHHNKVLGWQNPSYKDDTDSSQAYSGVPAIVGAGGDIDIANLTYGEAHSASGSVEIDSGNGLGFVGPLPLPAYQSDLLSQLEEAKSALVGSSSTGNKTTLLSSRLGIGDLLDIMFGGSFNPETMLSLRQAWKFPTPMIPGASIVVPGVVWEVWFHVPFQPDLGFSSKHDPDLSRLEELAKGQEEASGLLQEAKHKVDEAKAKLDAARAVYTGHPTQDNQDALDEAQDEYDDAVSKLDVVKDYIEDSADEAGAIAQGKMGSGMSSLPQTRDEDPSGRDGQWGWNYSKTSGKMVNLVTSIIKGGDVKDIAAAISTDVRVVHYGPSDEVPEFDWQGNKFVSKSTWTVPSSRTLRYDGDMEIRGDLWLQRGTVMVVNGDLNVTSPVGTASLTDNFAPSGKVFFEEGSTLIVTGNFSCQGSAQFGSIMVAGEPGEVHPISSALLVDGEVNIPYGIYAGHTLSDLIAALDPAALGLSGAVADGVSDGIAAGARQVEQLMAQQAPLMSKLAGPFHLRNPYFARYATTFQMVTIPFPPVLAITPIPSPKENLQVFAFRAETFAYTAGLNAALGENLYPQADWWPFGNGVVPMALNLDLVEALKSSTKAAALVSSSELDPDVIESQVRGFVDTLEKRSVKWAIEKGVQKLTMEAARILTPGGFGPIVDSITAVMNELKNDEDAVDDFYAGFVTEFQNRMGDHGRDLLSDLLVRTNVMDSDKYLKEYAGILIHGQSIRFGPEARQVSGMFIADLDITSEADLTVGTLMSRNGSIDTRDFLYYPYFNQASLYLPKPVPGDDAIQRATFEKYGAAHDSGMAVQVGPPPVTPHATSGGWQR